MIEGRSTEAAEKEQAWALQCSLNFKTRTNKQFDMLVYNQSLVHTDTLIFLIETRPKTSTAPDHQRTARWKLSASPDFVSESDISTLSEKMRLLVASSRMTTEVIVKISPTFNNKQNEH